MGSFWHLHLVAFLEKPTSFGCSADRLFTLGLRRLEEYTNLVEAVMVRISTFGIDEVHNSLPGQRDRLGLIY